VIIAVHRPQFTNKPYLPDEPYDVRLTVLWTEPYVPLLAADDLVFVRVTIRLGTCVPLLLAELRVRVTVSLAVYEPLLPDAAEYVRSTVRK
jgi:hypothetical protein